MSKTDKTIQDSMSELSELVAWFDSEDFELEKALDVFKQAEKLASDIEQELKTLKNEVVLIKQKFSEG